MLPSQTATYPLTDPAFLEDPYPVYRRMRQRDPVYWSDALGHWVLTRYDDVLAAARHPALGNARGEVSARAQLRGSDTALAADYTRSVMRTMIMKDGQDHHRLRVLGNHAFTLSALQRWQSVIERVVDDLLDAALPRGRMDLIDDLARPLPAIVIAELFGIPPQDRETFHQWSMAGARFFLGAVGHADVSLCHVVRRGGHIARTSRRRRMAAGSKGTRRRARGSGPRTPSAAGGS